MKKFCIGLCLGLLIGLSVVSYASSPKEVKMFVNGSQVYTDVPPQIINGRVMVPARFVAEPLGALVDWDGANVLINSPTALVSEGYYTSRQVAEALYAKYPNLEVSTLKREGTVFVAADGYIWFDGQDFTLPYRTIKTSPYFSIQPLIDAGILSHVDIGVFQ